MIDPNNRSGEIPSIKVNREEEPRERKARPRSHSTGVGGILATLYRSLVLDMTNGAGASPMLMTRLMNKYLARCAKDDPTFNKTNTRGNMNKELTAPAMTFRTLCRAFVFWEFKNVTIRIEGTREDGSKASASIDVNFSLPDQEENGDAK